MVDTARGARRGMTSEILKPGSICVMVDDPSLLPLGRSYVGKQCRVLTSVRAVFRGEQSTAYKVQFTGSSEVYIVMGFVLRPVPTRTGSWHEIYEICRYRPPQVQSAGEPKP